MKRKIVPMCFFRSLLVSLVIISQPVQADPAKKIKDEKQIHEILHSIPYLDKTMPYKSLAERLPNLGLNVYLIKIQRLNAQDASGSDGEYKIGDVIFDFYTNEPNNAVTAICQIQSNFQFIKRDNKYIPTSRTSNFLVNWKCTAPRW